MRRGHRRCAVLSLAMAVAVLVPAGVAPGGGPNAPRFTDGKWSGTIVYSAAVNFGSGVTAQGSFDLGTFELNIKGADVTGTFHVTGEGSAQIPGGSGTLTAVADGTATGTGAAPVLDPQSASFNGSVSVAGVTVPVSFSFGPAELTDLPLAITSSTCEQVVGNFKQVLQNAIGGTGAEVTSLTANIFATRTGAAGDSNEALADLMTKAQAVADAFVATGTLDGAALAEVVEEAEAFSSSLAKSSECGIVTQPGNFSLAITGIVRDMVELAFANAGNLTTDQFTDLLWWGTQVGAIGEGAIDQEFSNQFLDDAQALFETRLDAAITAGDAAAITDIMIGAITMGWTDLAQDASNALDAL